MPCCVGCSRVDLGHELCAPFVRWYTILQTVHTAHKMAAHRYLTNRMTSLPLTADREETEWQKIVTIAKNNNFPAHLITRLKRHTQQKNSHRQSRQQNQKMGHLHIPQL